MEQQYSLQQLADMVGGRVQGNPDVLIHGLNGIEYATDGEITFVLNAKQLPLPEACKASACIAPAKSEDVSLPLILCDDPSVRSRKDTSRLGHRTIYGYRHSSFSCYRSGVHDP